MAVAHHRLSLDDVFRRASGKGFSSELQDLRNLLYFFLHSYVCVESFDVRFVSGIFFVCELFTVFFFFMPAVVGLLRYRVEILDSSCQGGFCFFADQEAS